MPLKSSFSGYLTKKNPKTKIKTPSGKEARAGLSPACVSLRLSHPSEDRENWGVEGGKGGGAASHREKATGSCPRGASNTGNDPGTPPLAPPRGFNCGLQLPERLKKPGLCSQLCPQPLRSHTLEETAGFHPKTVTVAAKVPAMRSVALRDAAASGAMRPDTDFLGDYKKNKQIWVRDYIPVSTSATSLPQLVSPRCHPPSGAGPGGSARCTGGPCFCICVGRLLFCP